jgi:ribosome maturation factor RimP
VNVDQRIIEEIERLVIAEGFEFVACEVTGGAKQCVVRVFADRPEGITLDQCAGLSRHIGQRLDAADWISHAYTLEVSSPGVERGLYRVGDYLRFAGRRIRLKTALPIDGRRNFRGLLLEVQGGEEDAKITLQTGKTADAKLEISFSLIEKANLEVNLEDLFQAARDKEIIGAERRS